MKRVGHRTHGAAVIVDGCPKDRMATWEALDEPKPAWEAFKRMCPDWKGPLRAFRRKHSKS